MRPMHANEHGNEIWQNHPKRDEYREMNDGLGMCNTGSGWRGICALGGIGCNVNHIVIARLNLKERHAHSA